MPQYLGIAILDALHQERAVAGRIGERDGFRPGHSSVEFRNAMSMRIEFRVPEFGGDAFFESLRDEMFEALCLLMHFFYRVVEHLVKKGLDEPMVTQHFQSA